MEVGEEVTSAKPLNRHLLNCSIVLFYTSLVRLVHGVSPSKRSDKFLWVGLSIHLYPCWVWDYVSQSDPSNMDTSDGPSSVRVGLTIRPRRG